MIQRKGNFVFYIVNSKSNTIYNKITDPKTGNSVYPDILFRHDFAESRLNDAAVYNDAVRLMSEYGSAHCVFLSCKSEKDLAVLKEAAISTDTVNPEPYDGTKVKNFSHDLSLSVTMENDIRKLFAYYSYHGDVSELIDSIYRKFNLPVNRKEGKKIYEHIREIVLQ